MMKLDPPISTVEGCSAGGCCPGGGCVAAGIVVGFEITTTGVLSMTSVEPTTPEGAPAKGMVVATDMTIGELGGIGPLMIELIAAPIECCGVGSP
jgi:hypothetical protein